MSMDAPVVYLKVFKKLVDYCKEGDARGLMGIGTCSLQNIDGTFKKWILGHMLVNERSSERHSSTTT